MTRPGFIHINQGIVVITGDKEFRTIVQDIREDGFTILAPDRQEMLLLPGTEVKVVRYAKNGRYEFFTRVGCYISGEPPFYLLDYPDTCRRVQLRSHVRIKVALEFRYACWPAADWPHCPPEPQQKGITRNISSGGAEVVLPEAIEPDSLLYLKLDLPGRRKVRPLALTARVKRSKLRQVDGSEKHEVGLAFVDIGEKQEDQITAFVFQQLLKQKRRRG